MKAPLSYLPALPAAVGVITGILIYSAGAHLWVASVGAVIFITLYVLRLNYAAFISLFAVIGIILAHSARQYTLPEGYIGAKVQVTGQIKEADERAQSTSYIISVDQIDSIACRPFLIKANVMSSRQSIDAGTVITLKCTISTTDGNTDVPYETDYNRYLRAEGINYMTFARAEDLTVVREPDAWQSVVNGWRNTLYNAIVTSAVSSGTASFLLAVILGDNHLMSEDAQNPYRLVGVAHIMALSGLHVGVIAAMLSILLLPLHINSRGRMMRSILTLLIIWVYTVIAGVSPSLLRAAVMISVFICSAYIQRYYSPINSLLLSVVIILMVNPLWLYAPGFQMSVSAVASILIFGDMIPKTLKRRPVLYYSLNIVMIPVIAMLGTGIVSTYYFGYFPGMFLIGNIVTGILFPPLLCCGVILMVFTAFGIDFTLLGRIADILFQCMDTTIKALAEISGGAPRSIHFSPWLFIPYYSTLIALAYTIKRRSVTAGIITATALVGIFIIIDLTDKPIPDYELYIPSKVHDTAIIYRRDGATELWTDAIDHSQSIDNMTRRYTAYLSSRGCDTFAESPISRRQILNYLGKTLCVIDSVEAIPMSNHIDYALVCRQFAGDVQQIVNAVNPDTILFGPSVHPQRRKRLIRQCGDSVPYLNLNEKGLSIVR